MNEQVLIISAYGRGHSLAVSLQRAGIPTKIMEVSDSLGVWIPEEIEGPFGIFQNEQLTEQHLERLIEDDPLVLASQGFCFWLNDGPLELHGPNVAHRIEKMNLSMKLDQPHFISEAARYYAAHSYLPRKAVFDSLPELPLFSKFSIRMPTRQGFNKSVEWCRRNNVAVIEKAEIMDLIAQDRKNLRAIEFRVDKSVKSEIIEFGYLIWCLSSEETILVPEQIQKLLYPKGIIEPDWIWSRYRIKISEGIVRDQIPIHSVIIGDLDQPWTHENFTILIRTGSEDQFDAWIRTPANQRFNKHYLEQRGDQLLETLSKKMVNLNIEVVQYPVGFGRTFEEMGPSRQPIYAEGKIKNHTNNSAFENLIYNSYEQAQGLGWNFYFDYQKEVVVTIERWWEKLQLKKQKKAKESSRD